MAVFFRSLISGSSGNCLAIWNEKTNVLIDCGSKTQKLTRKILEFQSHRMPPINGIVITHHHGDHINYSSLKVLSDCNLKIWAHRETVEKIRASYECNCSPKYRSFENNSFRVGDFEFEPFEVDHIPGILTHGYKIIAKNSRKRLKIVIATDFCRYADIFGRFCNADFIYIEANWDKELLIQNPNYNSRYHMANEHTGRLLAMVKANCEKFPDMVMLGHLSEIRNRPKVAVDTVKKSFRQNSIPLDFKLLTAPRYNASQIIRID